MTEFPVFQEMEGLVKIPLVPEDKEIFYIQYAYLKSAMLNQEVRKLIRILDELYWEDEGWGVEIRGVVVFLMQDQRKMVYVF